MATYTKSSTLRQNLNTSWTSAGAGHPVYTNSKKFVMVSTLTGEQLPKWAQVIDEEGNATTPLTASRQTVKVEPGIVQYQFKDKKFGFDDYMLNVGTASNTDEVPQAIKDLAIARATAKFYAKIRERQTPFEGAVFTGELRETINMLKHPLKGMVDLTEILNRKRRVLQTWKSAGDASKALADLWLEYRFGVLPLMSDVSEIMGLAEEVAQRESVTAFDVYAPAESSSIVITKGALQAGLPYTREIRTTHKAQCSIKAGFKREYLENLAGSKSLFVDSVDDYSSLPIAAWELTPFSFLIDYFVNIGDIIASSVSSHSAISWSSQSVISTTTKVTISRDVGIDRPDLFTKIVSQSPKVVTTQFRSVKRTNAVAAIPPLVFTLPGSTVRYANIAALLVLFSGPRFSSAKKQLT